MNSRFACVRAENRVQHDQHRLREMNKREHASVSTNLIHHDEISLLSARNDVRSSKDSRKKIVVSTNRATFFVLREFERVARRSHQQKFELKLFAKFSLALFDRERHMIVTFDSKDREASYDARLAKSQEIRRFSIDVSLSRVSLSFSYEVDFVVSDC